MSKLNELQEKRAQLHADIKAHADLRGKDGVETGEWTAKWDLLNKDYDANLASLTAEVDKARAEAAERAAIEARLAEMGGYQNYDPGRNTSRIGRDGGSLDDVLPAGAGGNATDQTALRALALQGWFRAAGPRRGQVTDKHREAAKRCGIELHWPELTFNLEGEFGQMRNSLLPQRHGFRNALSSLDGPAGGFTFGDTFIGQLEKAMLHYGGILQVATVMRTEDSGPIHWVTGNDTANTGRQIGESAAVSNLDPSFGEAVWNAYKFTSDEVLVPFELLRNSAFDMAQEVFGMLGERLGRVLNTKCTTGSGAATCKGMVTCAAAGVTTAGATSISFDEWIDLEHSLDISRRNSPGVGYMFHDNILKATRKLKTGTGEYLWQSGANAGAPDTLNRYPYQINNDMAGTIEASAVTALFGEFRQYRVRQVQNVRLYRLVERYRENDQDAFLAFTEFDGNLLNSGDNPIKKMTQHA